MSCKIGVSCLHPKIPPNNVATIKNAASHFTFFMIFPPYLKNHCLFTSLIFQTFSHFVDINSKQVAERSRKKASISSFCFLQKNKILASSIFKKCDIYAIECYSFGLSLSSLLYFGSTIFEEAKQR